MQKSLQNSPIQKLPIKPFTASNDGNKTSRAQKCNNFLSVKVGLDMNRHSRYKHFEYEGVSHQFTKGFNQVMYADNSIQTSTLKRDRFQNHLMTLKKKEEQIKDARQDLRRRKIISQQILVENPGYKVTQTKLDRTSVENLIELRQQLRLNKIFNDAATKIQRWIRNLKSGNKKMSILQILKQVDNIVKIQRRYRSHRQKIEFRKHLARVSAKVIILQRFVRKVLLNNIQRKKDRLLSNLSYFDKMKFQIQEDAQIKIAYVWRKYKLRKQKQKEQEERLAELKRQELEAQKKKKKKGKSKRKLIQNADTGNNKSTSKTGTNSPQRSPNSQEQTVQPVSPLKKTKTLAMGHGFTNTQSFASGQKKREHANSISYQGKVDQHDSNRRYMIGSPNKTHRTTGYHHLQQPALTRNNVSQQSNQSRRSISKAEAKAQLENVSMSFKKPKSNSRERVNSGDNNLDAKNNMIKTDPSDNTSQKISNNNNAQAAHKNQTEGLFKLESLQGLNNDGSDQHKHDKNQNATGGGTDDEPLSSGDDDEENEEETFDNEMGSKEEANSQNDNEQNFVQDYHDSYTFEESQNGMIKVHEVSREQQNTTILEEQAYEDDSETTSPLPQKTDEKSQKNSKYMEIVDKND